MGSASDLLTMHCLLRFPLNIPPANNSVTIEGGGKDGFYVAEDTHLPSTVHCLVHGAFDNTGQVDDGAVGGIMG